MKPGNRVTFAVVLAFGLTVPAIAEFADFTDADGERAKLAQLVHELEVLMPLVAEARAQANPDARIRFRYEWLIDDLARLTRGIRRHIEVPRLEPRTFPALKGDYRE